MNEPKLIKTLYNSNYFVAPKTNTVKVPYSQSPLNLSKTKIVQYSQKTSSVIRPNIEKVPYNQSIRVNQPKLITVTQPKILSAQSNQRLIVAPRTGTITVPYNQGLASTTKPRLNVPNIQNSVTVSNPGIVNIPYNKSSVTVPYQGLTNIPYSPQSIPISKSNLINSPGLTIPQMSLNQNNLNKSIFNPGSISVNNSLYMDSSGVTMRRPIKYSASTHRENYKRNGSRSRSRSKNKKILNNSLSASDLGTTGKYSTRTYNAKSLIME